MIVVDSNLIVASVVIGHDFHARARTALTEALRTGELVMLQNVLIESFSVLTRAPEPIRMRPEVAYEVLNTTCGSCPVVPTSLRDVWQFLRERDIQTAAGRIYDALIAVTAIQAGAQRLLTFNAKHFQPFADRIEIVVPA
jgi:predicted nucleic acid-binding protein